MAPGPNQFSRWQSCSTGEVRIITFGGVSNTWQESGIFWNAALTAAGATSSVSVMDSNGECWYYSGLGVTAPQKQWDSTPLSGNSWSGSCSCVTAVTGCMTNTAGDNSDIDGYCSNGTTQVGYPGYGLCPGGTGYLVGNYDPNATVAGTCFTPVLGCTDSLATNYNASANVDDGSCTYCVDGCTDATANNYNSNATCDDGSCTYDLHRWTNCDTGSKANLTFSGASNTVANNNAFLAAMTALQPLITGSSYSIRLTDESCWSYDGSYTQTTHITTTQASTTIHASCACNPAPPAAVYYTFEQCPASYVHIGLIGTSTISEASSLQFYNEAGSPSVNQVVELMNGDCYKYIGTNSNDQLPTYVLQTSDFSGAVGISDCASCGAQGTIDTFHEWKVCGTSDLINLVASGQSNTSANNIAFHTATNNPLANQVVDVDGTQNCYEYIQTNTVASSNGFQTITLGTTSTHTDCTACQAVTIYGCTDIAASNYNASATVDDGSCTYLSGCTDATATNYNPNATLDDGSCYWCTYGCTDPSATNYSSSATCDDGSCGWTSNGGGADCTASFTEACQPDETSTVTIDLSTGSNLQNVRSFVNGSSFTASAGCTAPASIDVTGLLPNDTVKVTGECSYSTESSPDGDPTPPAWTSVIGDCGLVNISVDTKVYVFYDGTSLGNAAVKSAYNAVMSWLTEHPDFTPVLRDPSQQVNYNNQNAAGAYAAFSYGTTPGENVYHVSVGGERWVDWGIVPMTGIFNNSVDPSADPTYDSNTGGNFGSYNTSGAHEGGYGHTASEVLGYSYMSSIGTITGELNHWVGWGVNHVGSGGGSNPSQSNWPNNFSSISVGAGNRNISLSKPDGVNFNNASGGLRTHQFWPIYAPWGRSPEALKWSFNSYKNSTAITLTDSNNTSLIPVQMYDASDYDTATGKGPRGHSLITYTSSNYTKPNTWSAYMEEADAATANSGTDPVARSKNNAVHLGPPPAANPNTDDVLVIVFADESDYSYHGDGASTPTFQDNITASAKGEDENPYKQNTSTHTASIPSFITHTIANDKHVQPTPQYKFDCLEFNERRAAYVAVAGKTYAAFMYPSKPTAGASSQHKALPLMGLAAIATGTGAQGAWTAGTTPKTTGTYSDSAPYPDSNSGTRDKCDYSNLTELETANPYWDITSHPVPAGNPNTTNWGNLETKGWGINTQCRSFTTAQFEQDLLLFLGQGGTACDGSTQCILIEVLDQNSAPVSGYPITVNGVSQAATNGSGQTVASIITGGTVMINDCYSFVSSLTCTRTKVTITLYEDSFTAVLNCILGCTDSGSWNYNPNAGVDDGSCMFPIDEVDPLSRCEQLKLDINCTFASNAYNLYKSERYGLDKGCLVGLDSHINKKYNLDWSNKMVPYQGTPTYKTTLHTNGATPLPSWVSSACGMGQEDLTLYFMYDATSLSQQSVTQARTAVDEWIDEIRAARAGTSSILNLENCSGSTIAGSITVYHTVVAGERWIDWAIFPMTGTFNNYGEFNSRYCGGSDSPSGQHLTGEGIVDAVIPDGIDVCHFWSILMYDTPTRVWYNAGGTSYTCSNCTGNSTADNYNGAFYSGTLLGEPPTPLTDNVLVVAFADESGVGLTSTNPTVNYHHNQSTTTPTWRYSMDGSTGNPAGDGVDTATGYKCSTCYMNDYNHYIAEYLSWMSYSSDREINCFLYPSAPTVTSSVHYHFPLHALGAIESGDTSPTLDGQLASTPPNGLASASLSAITTANPYYTAQNTVTNHIANSRLNSGYGGLDQYGWGVNVAEVAFTKERFVADLATFWDLDTCNDSECIVINVINSDGNPVANYDISIDGANTGMTDANGELRTCIPEASINTDHTVNLCWCFTTTGLCNSQKITITVADTTDCNKCNETYIKCDPISTS